MDNPHHFCRYLAARQRFLDSIDIFFIRAAVAQVDQDFEPGQFLQACQLGVGNVEGLDTDRPDFAKMPTIDFDECDCSFSLSDEGGTLRNTKGELENISFPDSRINV